jgi:DNA gyrase subunit A
MMITNTGKLIRCPICDVRIIGRNSQGVSLLKTAEGEVVVSAVSIKQYEDNEEEGGEE